MLGYTTEAAALDSGCTHWGSLYGVPVWIGDIDSDCPLVYAKWAPLDLIVLAISGLQALLWPLIHGPDSEPGFAIKVIAEIPVDRDGV